MVLIPLNASVTLKGGPSSHNSATVAVRSIYVYNRITQTQANAFVLVRDLSRVLGAAYCWATRGIVLGLWRANGGESGMLGGEGG